MNENASPPPQYPQVVVEESEADEQEGGGEEREEERLHLAEILGHQEVYAEMIERRIQLQNSRPQTPPHMHMTQRIRWKRDQIRIEQTPQDDLQLEDSDEPQPEETPEEPQRIYPPIQTTDPPPQTTDPPLPTAPFPQMTAPPLQIIDPPPQIIAPPPQIIAPPPQIIRTPPDRSPPRSPVNSIPIVVPPPSTQESPRTDPPNNRKETTITISESGHDPGKSLLSVSIVFNNNSARRNSAPNRMLQIEPNHSQLSAEKTYEEQKREKRNKNDTKKKKNKKKSNRIHPIAAFVEKTKEPDKQEVDPPKEDDQNDTPVPGPSAEDEQTLQKIKELENKVDSNLNDLLGPERRDVITDKENNEENKGDAEIKSDTPDKNDKPNEDGNADNSIQGSSAENEENKDENDSKSDNTEISKDTPDKTNKPSEDDEDDKPVPGPSAEDAETLKQIRELEDKVESDLDDLLGPDRQDLYWARIGRMSPQKT